MKRISIILTTIIFCFLFSSAAFAEPLATLDTDDGIVNIVGYTTTEDEGTPVFVALLEYTNTSDESKAPGYNYVANAFQDGIELESAYMYDYEYDDYKTDTTKVRPNSTLKYYKSFKLSNNSPVDVEIAPIFSWDNEHAEYTFDLSDGEIIDNSADETSEESGEVLEDQTDWEAKYNKLLKKYKKLKKKYKKLKDSTEAAS